MDVFRVPARRLIAPRVVFLRPRGRGIGDINSIAQAVQTVEGYCPPNTTYGCAPCATGAACAYPAGTVAWQNNNPGNLEYRGQPGATQSGRWAKFPTYDAGYQALLTQIQRQADSGQTMQQFIYQYAPPTENNTERYLSSLESSTGYSRNAPLTAVLSGSPAMPISADLTGSSGDADASMFPDAASWLDASGSVSGSDLPGWAMAAIPAAILLAIALA